jgi:hypothetical protein
MRNEKWAKALYKREAPTIQDAMQMIGFYIRHIYGETEQLHPYFFLYSFALFLLIISS